MKNFLHYADCASRGEQRLASAVLESLNPLTRSQLAPPAASEDAVISQLAGALRERGIAVDEHVGQSRFRCDLAIRPPDARQYEVGIIVDTARHYANRNIIERSVTQPGILRAFGWRIALVLTRDWYHEPDAVLERIERLARGQEETPVDKSEDDTFPEPKPTATEKPTTLPPPETPAVFEHLEFAEGRSSKFWEIARDGNSVTVRYGRIGTQGRTQTKMFDTPERAERERDKLTAEKLRKGYRALN